MGLNTGWKTGQLINKEGHDVIRGTIYKEIISRKYVIRKECCSERSDSIYNEGCRQHSTIFLPVDTLRFHKRRVHAQTGGFSAARQPLQTRAVGKTSVCGPSRRRADGLLSWPRSAGSKTGQERRDPKPSLSIILKETK